MWAFKKDEKLNFEFDLISDCERKLTYVVSILSM